MALLLAACLREDEPNMPIITAPRAEKTTMAAIRVTSMAPRCPCRRGAQRRDSPLQRPEDQAGKPPGQKKDHGDQDRTVQGQKGKPGQRRHQEPDKETGDRLAFNGRGKRRPHLVVITDKGLPRICRKQNTVPELPQHLDHGMVRVALGGRRHEALLAA